MEYHAAVPLPAEGEKAKTHEEGKEGGEEEGDGRNSAEPSSEIMELANVMRGFGVRLANAHENMGERKFAFNALQRKCLPPCYRPPVDTLVSIAHAAPSFGTLQRKDSIT